MNFVVRDAAEADVGPIAAIYAHHVRTALATFEEVAPSVAEMARRRADTLAGGLPYLVAAEPQGVVLGYAYASLYRTRSAYRYSLEDSIYVAPEAARRGIGSQLLGTLIERCAASGYRQMVAIIGDGDNAASIGLHEKLGFRRAGTLQAVGFKLGRWVDSVIMQRPLGPGATLPAD